VGEPYRPYDVEYSGWKGKTSSNCYKLAEMNSLRIFESLIVIEEVSINVLFIEEIIPTNYNQIETQRSIISFFQA
jgi:hypothetical protein